MKLTVSVDKNVEQMEGYNNLCSMYLVKGWEGYIVNGRL